MRHSSRLQPGGGGILALDDEQAGQDEEPEEDDEENEDDDDETMNEDDELELEEDEEAAHIDVIMAGAPFRGGGHVHVEGIDWPVRPVPVHRGLFTSTHSLLQHLGDGAGLLDNSRQEGSDHSSDGDDDDTDVNGEALQTLQMPPAGNAWWDETAAFDLPMEVTHHHHHHGGGGHEMLHRLHTSAQQEANLMNTLRSLFQDQANSAVRLLGWRPCTHSN